MPSNATESETDATRSTRRSETAQPETSNQILILATLTKPELDANAASSHSILEMPDEPTERAAAESAQSLRVVPRRRRSCAAEPTLTLVWRPSVLRYARIRRFPGGSRTAVLADDISPAERLSPGGELRILRLVGCSLPGPDCDVDACRFLLRPGDRAMRSNGSATGAVDALPRD